MKLRNLFLFIILFYSGINFAQTKTIGKIFTKDDANTLYGNVIFMVTINVSELDSVLSQTQNVIMFNIMNKKLVLLGDNRKVISSDTVSISPTDVFAVCSKSKLLELLNYGDGTQINFEIRLNHPTITYGMHTLEETSICPPICF
jgi:hypothetical protein